jgi:hypothetical protein
MKLTNALCISMYTTVGALLLTISSFAQAPEKMSYQAVIRDAANALVINQEVGMQISVLQGTIAVYEETQTPTSNTNGLVSMEIGEGTIVSGDFSAIVWGNGTYFIKIETDPAGGSNYTITGISQLLSVPFALYANTSGDTAAVAENAAAIASESTTARAAEESNTQRAMEAQDHSMMAVDMAMEAQDDSMMAVDMAIEAQDHSMMAVDIAMDAHSSVIEEAAMARAAEATNAAAIAAEATTARAAEESNTQRAMEAQDQSMMAMDMAMTNEMDVMMAMDMVWRNEMDVRMAKDMAADAHSSVIEEAATARAAEATNAAAIAAEATTARAAEESNTQRAMEAQDQSMMAMDMAMTNEMDVMMAMDMVWRNEMEVMMAMDMAADAHSSVIEEVATARAAEATNAAAIAAEVTTARAAEESNTQRAMEAQDRSMMAMDMAMMNEMEVMMAMDMAWRNEMEVSMAKDMAMEAQDHSMMAMDMAMMNEMEVRMARDMAMDAHSSVIEEAVTARAAESANEDAIEAQATAIINNTAALASTTHAIGDNYGGGIIFWLDTSGQHGLIAATDDQSTGIQWYNGANTVTNAVRDGIGAGKINTERIIVNQGAGAYAAQICANYQGGNYGDWYLPSKYELNLLYAERATVGGFNEGSFGYWSSTENDVNWAWRQFFSEGNQDGNSSKHFTNNVRAVRAF